MGGCDGKSSYLRTFHVDDVLDKRAFHVDHALDKRAFHVDHVLDKKNMSFRLCT